MTLSGTICGPARGTPDKPYRCICCGTAYADIEALAVSICYLCMSGNTRCARCRERGIPLSDFRVGGYRKYGKTMRYYHGGGKLHRYASTRRTLAIMSCGVEIPKKHLGGGEAVVPPCKTCWPKGAGW